MQKIIDLAILLCVFLGLPNSVSAQSMRRYLVGTISPKGLKLVTPINGSSPTFREGQYGIQVIPNNDPAKAIWLTSSSSLDCHGTIGYVGLSDNTNIKIVITAFGYKPYSKDLGFVNGSDHRCIEFGQIELKAIPTPKIISQSPGASDGQGNCSYVINIGNPLESPSSFKEMLIEYSIPLEFDAKGAGSIPTHTTWLKLNSLITMNDEAGTFKYSTFELGDGQSFSDECEVIAFPQLDELVLRMRCYFDFSIPANNSSKLGIQLPSILKISDIEAFSTRIMESCSLMPTAKELKDIKANGLRKPESIKLAFVPSNPQFSTIVAKITACSN